MAKQPTISIGSRLVGNAQPCLVIAEIAQAHDGSLGSAHAYIDAVANAGGEAIKFQTHIADAESSPQEPFRTGNFPQDESRYAYWKRMEFTTEQWSGLAAHARDKGLIFLSTPFSVAAVELLDRLEIPAWKIGSGEVENIPMLEIIARTGKPVLLSSGMSTWTDLDNAVTALRTGNTRYAMLQCTSAYPCPAQELGLNIIDEMKQRYQCPVGLSDHSGNIHASLAAVTLGADIIEVHTVISRECFGPDVASSVTTVELKQLIEGGQFIETALRYPVDKDESAASRLEMKHVFGKSLVADRTLRVGHILSADDVAFKKPGLGIPANRIQEFIGRNTGRNYSRGEFLEENDFE